MSDNRLYTMGHLRGEEIVWCLDAATGKPIWKHSYPEVLNDHLYEGGPGATPTVDGDFVFTLGIGGRLICFQRVTGEIVWQLSLKDELRLPMHEWGYNSSPRILGDQLIIECGYLVSFDRTTGQVRWKSPEHDAGYGSVAVFARGNETLLASLDCEGLRISDAETGRQIAFREWKSPFRTNSTTPIIAGDTIYISSGYNVGCGLFRLRGNELDEIYTSQQMRNHFNNSILFKGCVYGFDGNSNLGRVVRLTCMKHDTGEILWQQDGFGCGSLMIADGKLLILSDKGQLVVATASPDSFHEIARAEILNGRCWTVPVLLNGRVFARNARGTLVCVQLPRR
ncbi:MAG: PQQ-binding-like beta-propeller repeat protein [Planctomycetaceae bacterium]|nr:PQQ-binding-like beta-propeller repeat protein [Planctomycetaceae bacterium]